MTLKVSFVAVALARLARQLRPRFVARLPVVLGVAASHVLPARAGQYGQEGWRLKCLPERAIRRQGGD
jgi:hypothetical protein